MKEKADVFPCHNAQSCSTDLLSALLIKQTWCSLSTFIDDISLFQHSLFSLTLPTHVKCSRAPWTWVWPGESRISIHLLNPAARSVLSIGNYGKNKTVPSMGHDKWVTVALCSLGHFIFFAQLNWEQEILGIWVILGERRQPHGPSHIGRWVCICPNIQKTLPISSRTFITFCFNKIFSLGTLCICGRTFWMATPSGLQIFSKYIFFPHRQSASLCVERAVWKRGLSINWSQYFTGDRRSMKTSFSKRNSFPVQDI